MTEGVFPKSDGEILFASEANLFFDRVPVGTVLPWLKSLTNTPALHASWVECNGQTLSDSDSPYDGQIIPNLNAGTYRMLRGASTSGGTGGSDTKNLQHNHSLSTMQGFTGSGSQFILTSTSTGNGLSTTQDILPAYYEVVYILRVK
jgi:hypothetical protein